MSNAASDAVLDLAAAPAEGQRIRHDNVVYTTVREGLAHILIPEDSAGPGQTVQEVFYNPIQQFNRDLTVLAMRAYGRERVAQKQAAGRARAGRHADRKRKRREQAQGEPPAKSPRLGGEGGEGEEGEARQPDAEMHDVPPAAAAELAPADAAAEAAHEPRVPFTILDALSASGLRALRYAREIPFATSVTANDILRSAADAIERNAVHNRLRDKINISVDDATAHMYSIVVKELRRTSVARGKPGPSEKYDVIDLDPYGTAAPFLDAAVQAVRDDGGLLCVTCTDSGVWASNGYPEKCYSLYGGVPVKGWYSHEVGIRLILHAIETAAAKYGLAMEPLLSLSVDFYCRVFVRIRKAPFLVKFQGGKTMVVYSCGSGCGAWTTQPLMRNKPAPNKKGDGIFYKHGFTRAPTTGTRCEHCGSTMHLAGPMYAGRIHSPEFVQAVIAEAEEAPAEIYGTRERIRGVLQTALEEFLPSPEEETEAEAEAGAGTGAGTGAGADEGEGGNGNGNGNGTRNKPKKNLAEAKAAAVDPYPFYFHPAHVSGVLHCASPSEPALRGALIRLGYRVTRSHCKAGSMKTDAPWSVIWHVFREWIRQKAPVKEENIKPGSVAYRLLRLGGKAGDGEREKDETAEEAPEEAPDSGETSAETKKETDVTKLEVVFDEQLGRYQDKKKYVRYQMNPRENWGPMNRARGK
ncbi:hypothetical protein VTH06DRAFT_2938 [Thermothelomyces fergusii]